MAMIGADHLSLLIGDGGGTEVFTALKGTRLTRLEVTQKSNPSTAIGSDAWLMEVGASGRRALLECEAYATDEAPALRLRTLALTGNIGNFKLEVSATRTLNFAAMVTRYREIIDAGDIKRVQCSLETSGAVSVV